MGDTHTGFFRQFNVGIIDKIVSLFVIYLFLRVLRRLCEAQKSDNFARVAEVFD